MVVHRGWADKQLVANLRQRVALRQQGEYLPLPRAKHRHGSHSLSRCWARRILGSVPLNILTTVQQEPHGLHQLRGLGKGQLVQLDLDFLIGAGA